MKKKELKARIAELESDLNVALARLSVAQMELAELRKSPPHWPHDHTTTITQPSPAPWFPYVPQLTCDALPLGSTVSAPAWEVEHWDDGGWPI